MSEVKLNPRQAEAVNWDDGPLLVLAGPGTGKTQLLSARVERILRETDASPETILCLTFTESGASNMRERLARTIGKDARKVNIHTYHAFGSTILGYYKNYAESFSRPLDSPIDTVTQFKLIKTIQSELPALDILRSAATEDIVSTIASAKAARLSAKDLRHIAETNIKDSAELSSEISPLLDQIIPRMKLDAALPIYQDILAVLARHSSAEELAPRIEPLANELLRELNSIIEEIQQSDKPKLSPLTSWKTAHFEKSADGSWRLKDHIANKKLLSLAGIMSAYESALADSGLYDFADMIEEAISALKSDRGFRLSMSERFQHILLDEFQDTNPSQFELIRLLCDYEKPDLMAVGDDDQAIFEFQGANASNLYDFQAHFGAHLVNLEENYRSLDEIVATAKRVSAQIEGSFSKQSGIAKILRAFRGSTPSAKVVERHEFISSDAEYYWVAEQISELVKDGICQNDIAVIMPKHKYIAPLLPYLRSHPELRVAYEKRDDLFLDPRLSQLLTLAEFISDLANEKKASHRLLEILAFPFWGIRPSLALEVVTSARSEHKSALDYLTKAKEPELQQLGDFFATLALRSFDTNLELFLDYLLGSVPLGNYRSPFIEFYAQDMHSYETFELYENLAVLKEAIKKHARSDQLRLSDLIDFYHDYQAAGQPLVNTSPYRESNEAIQILTAHKSKGLEFKYVFMMSVNSAAWGRAKGNNNLLALPKNLSLIRHTGITEDEQKRLLFVAMTRARDCLIMTNSLADFSGKSPARLEYLDEREEPIPDNPDQKQILSPYLPANSQIVEQHLTPLPEAAQCTDLIAHWTSAYLRPDPDLRSLLLNRMQNYRLTATDLTTFIDICYAGPMEFFRRKVLRTPSEPSTAAIEYGNLIHAVFEQVTTNHLSDDDALALFRSEALKVPLDEKERNILLEKGAYSLEIALRDFSSILRAPNAKAELSFASEQLAFRGVPLTGKIDHLHIDPESHTIEIYDFKTGNYHKEGWSSHQTLYKYALQLEFYRLLLEASPSWRGYQLSGAHILFVTPDAEGRVYDRPYHFDLDRATLEQLITAVYQQASSLAFLDDLALALEPDSKRSLKDIKEFISTLLSTPTPPNNNTKGN